MQSTINSTEFYEGEEITLTAKPDSGAAANSFYWVINFTTDDLQYSIQQLQQQGRVFKAISSGGTSTATGTVTITQQGNLSYTLTPLLLQVPTTQYIMSAMGIALNSNQYFTDTGTTYNITWVSPPKTIRGIVTWLKQWFYDKDNEMKDTGWTSFPYREVSYPVKIVTVDGGSMSEIANASSWQSLTGSTSTTFMKDYSSAGPVRVRRIGKVVHIEGAMTSDVKINNEFPLKGLACGDGNVTTYTGDYYFTVGTLSEEFRPSSTIITVQQGSGINRFQLRILPSGNVRIGRYGTTTYVNPAFNSDGSGPWLNFNVTYTVGEEW